MRVLLGETTSNPAHQPHKLEEHKDLEDKLQSDFSKDGEPARWASGHPKTWGTEIWKFATNSKFEAVTSAAATSDERYLALAVNQYICIFSLTDLQLVTVLKNNFGSVQKIEIAKTRSQEDHDIAALGYVLAAEIQEGDRYYNRQIKLWHLSSSCKPTTIDKHKDSHFPGRLLPFSKSAFSNDGFKFLYVSKTHDDFGEHPVVKCLDILSGKELYTLNGHTDSIMCACFSSDDKLVATTAWDGLLLLYSACTGKLVRQYGPTGGQNWICIFSPDANNIAVSRGSGAGPSTFVWRTDTDDSFPITLRGERGWQRAMAWSFPSQEGEHQRLAIGAADGRLIVHNANGMVVEQVWQLAEVDRVFLREIHEVKFLNDGRRILFRSGDGAFQIYDFDSNMKWKWGPGKDDKMVTYIWDQSILLERMGLLGSKDWDGVFRLWKIPSNLGNS